jgi:hypothetical protein
VRPLTSLAAATIGPDPVKTFEEAVRALGVHEARVCVRSSLPSNLRFYEDLGYRALASRPYPTGTDFEITLRKVLD